MRYVAILAVIVPFFGAALMFLLGTLDTVNAYLIFFGQVEPEGTVDAGEAAMVKLVASVDHFLFATILIIFAFGLYYFLFRPAARSSPPAVLPSRRATPSPTKRGMAVVTTMVRTRQAMPTT